MAHANPIPRLRPPPASAAAAVLLLTGAAFLAPASAQDRPGAPELRSDAEELRREAETLIEGVLERVVEWRRHLHRYPELSNREFETARYVAEHLESLGLEVRTGVAHTGVVGVLRGGRPGPVVALRADMDALPVTERVDLPFASRETTIYEGREVGVMHACGHDNHMAILMGAADVLAAMRERLPGTIVFIFQPAEEGAPAGESGGASLMIAEGALENPRPEAIFGLHVTPDRVGHVRYRAGGIMAASQGLRITVRGRQTHGALPWAGVDPVTVAAQIILGLQTVISRQVDLTTAPAIVTVGSIQGGVRGNIIPDSVVLVGTIRTLDEEMKREVNERVVRTAERIAESAGAEAEVSIGQGLPVTWNDPELTRRMVPTLEWAAGPERVGEVRPWTAAEDFSFYQREIPGLFVFLGIVPEGVPLDEAPANHSPYFHADEAALPVGLRVMTGLALDYLAR